MHQSKSLLYIFLCITASLFAEEHAIRDITEISFEELLQTEYIPASHIANQISSSASAVSVVTANDIQIYGYRTLGEILNSMRGLHTFEDDSYTFLGGRGYGEPGDYAGRIILLIDGYKANESFYGQAFFDEDGLLDLSVIERVEYIPGGNSSGYATGALLGAVNIITKKGSDIDGLQLAYHLGSHQSQTKRATFGQKFDNGLELVWSASMYNTQGRDFSFIDADTGDEILNNNNDAKNHRLFLKASYENFSLEAASVTFIKNLPSYPSSAFVSDVPIEQTDKSRFVRLRYDRDIMQDTKMSLSLWHGQYDWKDYDPVSYSELDETVTNGTKSKWNGGDVKIIGNWLEGHTISLGQEYRYDYDQEAFNIYTNPTGVEEYTTTYESRKTYSSYIYDNYMFLPDFSVNLGLRYDTSSYGNKAFSPQIALLWNVTDETSLKLSGGRTNRQTTMFEEAGKKLEKADKNELVAEHTFDEQMKLLASVYRYEIKNRFFFEKLPDIHAHGAEVELEKYFQEGTHLRISYAYQKAHETEGNTPLVNTPHHLAKLNIAVPLTGERLKMGWELHYVGAKPDNERKSTPSQWTADVNIFSHHWLANTDISFKIKNLFNKKYDDITWEQFSGDEVRPREERTFLLQLEYLFQ